MKVACTVLRGRWCSNALPLPGLGWNVRKYDGKLLIKPSKASIKSHLEKLREIIKANKSLRQVDLIKMLNPVLRGWANYHCHMVAKETFARIDHAVWFMLWQWAKRRHPNKGAFWVTKKYFKTQGNRKWVFAAEDEEQGKVIRLLFESDTPIRRHLKIKADANPHDPKWHKYFQTRWAREYSAKGNGGRQRV